MYRKALTSILQLEERINQYHKNLNENDLMIWQYICTHKKACSRMSIYDLGAACNVSRTTILRFAKKIGFDGFSDLKALLKMDLSPVNLPDADIVQATIDLCQRVGKEMAKKDFSKVNERIFEARRIIAFGSGHVQQNVVNELLRLFVNSNILIYELKGHDEFELLLKNLTTDDLFIIVSLSGESPQVVQMAKRLQIYNVPVISITRLRDNTLAELSAENIYITPVQFPLTAYTATGQPYESLLMYFIVVEIWFVQYHRYQARRLASPDV